jgi:hypothetical protein
MEARGFPLGLEKLEKGKTLTGYSFLELDVGGFFWVLHNIKRPLSIDWIENVVLSNRVASVHSPFILKLLAVQPSPIISQLNPEKGTESMQTFSFSKPRVFREFSAILEKPTEFSFRNFSKKQQTFASEK